jgi:hypothetical protein
MKTLIANLRLLWKAYPMAKARVAFHDGHAKWPGEVKTQVAYREVCLALTQAGEKNITGAVVYLALSLSYLFNRQK